MHSRIFCKEARNMKNLFHRKLYFEALKKILLPGIVSAILIFCRSILPPIVELLFDSEHIAYIRTYDDFASDVGLLWILTPVLIYSMFSFMNKRKQADFYHSLPVKRSCMLTTMLAAVYTWVWSILLVSVFLSAFLWWMTGNVAISFGSLLLTVGMYLVATLYVGGFMILAMSISGTGFSNLTVTYLLMFTFRIISLIFYSVTNSVSPSLDLSHSVLAIFDVKYWFPAALAESQADVSILNNATLWLFTGVVIAACYLLAYIGFTKRKSQYAGQPAPEKWLRRLYSTLVALPLMFVGFVDWIVMDGGFASPFILFVLTVIICFIYELISTKKLLESISALKYLFIPAICCLCLTGGIYGITYVTNHTHYTADEIHEIRIYDGFSSDGLYEDSNGKNYETLLIQNITVDDYEAKIIISDAWKQTLKKSNNYDDRYFLNLTVEIILPSGKTYPRTLRISESKYQELKDIVIRSEECASIYTKLPLADDIMIYKDMYTNESNTPYLKELWNTFAKEYNQLSIEEKILYKQNYSNRPHVKDYKATVHLYVSGITDSQEAFRADYVIPESFVETRRLYMEANASRTDSFLAELQQISDMSMEQLKKKHNFYSISGNVIIDDQIYSFAFGIRFNDTDNENSNQSSYEKLEAFLDVVLPNATASFTDDAYISIYVTQYGASSYATNTTRTYVFGFKDMTDVERANFYKRLKKYIVNSAP